MARVSTGAYPWQIGIKVSESKDVAGYPTLTRQFIGQTITAGISGTKEDVKQLFSRVVTAHVQAVGISLRGNVTRTLYAARDITVIPTSTTPTSTITWPPTLFLSQALRITLKSDTSTLAAAVGQAGIHPSLPSRPPLPYYSRVWHGTGYGTSFAGVTICDSYFHTNDEGD